MRASILDQGTGLSNLQPRRLPAGRQRPAQATVVPVGDECVFWVFDDVEIDESDWFAASADLVSWIRADGRRHLRDAIGLARAPRTDALDPRANG
jgi:hypothetical protein